MFLFKKYLICTQQYILYQLYRTSCMKITDNCITGGNGSSATATFHFKQFLNCAKRLRGAIWPVMCSISKRVVHNKGCNLERSAVRFFKLKYRTAFNLVSPKLPVQDEGASQGGAALKRVTGCSHKRSTC